MAHTGLPVLNFHKDIYSKISRNKREEEEKGGEKNELLKNN